jgi:hypothetical protein
VRQNKLRWFGHVERKDEDDHVEICQLLERRGRKTWKECIADVMRKMELRREDTQDWVLWKNSILGNRPTRASAETRSLKR